MAQTTGSGPRLDFVQWLRVFLIALVVAHHAAQPYGPTGGAWPVDDPANSDALGPFFAINAAYFMGFFFLISGYFTPASYDRHGPSAFLAARLLRLGLPLLVFVVLVNGTIYYVGSETTRSYPGYLLHDYIGGRMDFGPLWFIAQLLVWAVLYALWRLAVPRRSRPVPVPGHLAIAAYAVVLTLSTLAVRSVWPQDTWLRILGVPFEPMHLPQYASLFLIGLIAARGDWFARLPTRVGAVWFTIGAALFLTAGGLLATGTRLPGGIGADEFWELSDSTVCVGMILGLLVFFRAHADHTGPLARRLAADTYGVYLIHVYVVIVLQMSLLGFPLGALAKFVLVTMAGFALSFALADTLRRLPPVRAVI